eukprot:5260912-Karenia_brevis.AAC.1
MDGATWHGYPIRYTQGPQHWPKGSQVAVVQGYPLLRPLWGIDSPGWETKTVGTTVYWKGPKGTQD